MYNRNSLTHKQISFSLRTTLSGSRCFLVNQVLMKPHSYKDKQVVWGVG